MYTYYLQLSRPDAPPFYSTVRIATFSSHPAIGEAKPTVPQYIPRRFCSQPVSSWRARSLGVPVTEAGGKVASSTTAIGISTSTRAVTVDTRCHRSEGPTSELPTLMRISYDVLCLK